MDTDCPPAKTYKTRTTPGSLQRCNVWVQHLEDGSNSAGKQSMEVQQKTVSNTSLQYKDVEISQDEFSESSSLSPRKRKKHISSSQAYQDDTEVDTSVASEVPSHPRQRRKELRSKSITIKPVCGWRNCNYFSTDVLAYVSHVSSHLPNIDIKVCIESDEEEVYMCMWESCDFETPNSDEISRHVNFHSYHTKMKCLGSVLCQEQVLPDCHYDTDGVNLVPDLPSVFECWWYGCCYTSNNPNAFFNHVQVHVSESDGFGSGENITIFRCQWRGCKVEVRHKKTRLSEHVRVHSKEKVIACPTCGSLFASRLKLIDHRKRQSTEECKEWNTYQCSYCSKFYPSERLLRDHMRHHVNHYKCQFCDMTCPSPSTLSHHIRHRHLDERPFQCQFCTYTSKTQFNMKRHMTTHLSTLNFACEWAECDFKCRSISILNWHYRKIHETPPTYCCHMCDRRFTRGAYLTKHLMKKHNFRWSSGNPRFRYKNDEDGLFRLQTVRYESLDVVEDIINGGGEETSVLKSNENYKVKTKLMPDGTINAKVMISGKCEGDLDPDDPDDLDECNSCCSSDREKSEENSDTKCTNGPSMPLLDDEPFFPHNRKVLISIDEIDTSGNIIRSSTMEADELLDIDERAQIVGDGDRLL